MKSFAIFLNPTTGSCVIGKYIDNWYSSGGTIIGYHWKIISTTSKWNPVGERFGMHVENDNEKSWQREYYDSLEELLQDHFADIL